MADQARRNGDETKAAAQRIALSLFSTKGYEATSMREIAEELGISKAALYYHFRSKEDIVASLLAERGTEAAELLSWLRAQQPSPDLLERTVLRWVDSFSVEKLRGIRFVNANPMIMRAIGRGSGRGIGDTLEAIAAIAVGEDADPARRMLVRMAFLSINFAALAGEGAGISDDDVITGARATARAILSVLREPSEPPVQHAGGRAAQA